MLTSRAKSQQEETITHIVRMSIQAFYNADILEEDSILDWHSERNPPAPGCKAEDTAAVKTAAQKFVDWLR